MVTLLPRAACQLAVDTAAAKGARTLAALPGTRVALRSAMSMWDSITQGASSLWDSASSTASGAVESAEDWLFPGRALIKHPGEGAALPAAPRAQNKEAVSDKMWGQAQKQYEERKAASPGKYIDPPRYRDYYE